MNDEFYHKTLEVLESTNNLRIDKKYVHGFPIIVGGRNYHEYYEIGIKFSGASNREKVPVLEMDALRKRLDGVW